MASSTNKPPDVEPGISQEALFEKIGFKPHSKGQSQYVSSTARFNIPCCGRRWGKSIAAGRRLVAKSFVKDSYFWIVGPTYKLAEKEFRVVFRDYEKLGLLKYCKKSYDVKGGNMRIETPWHAVIECVSADKPDSLLGEGLTHAIMSEAARHNRATWEQYIEPALSDLRGSCDFPSTPQGFNWYHGLHVLGQPGGMKDYRSFSFPSWTNSVRYPGGRQDPEILRIEQTASRQYFDQEYGALFTTFAGQIYDEFDENRHLRPITYNPKWPNYLAFDYGFANAFVCLDIQIAPDDTVFVWREYYRQYVSTVEHAEYLKNREQPKGYHIDGAWGDHRGPDQAATIGPILGVSVASMDVPWSLGVEEIKRLLKSDRLFIDPDGCPKLASQMQQLHIKDVTRRDSAEDLKEMTGDRNIQHKINDHAPDALRYFIGPIYVMGAGISLEDIYGQNYKASESADFVRLHANDAVILGEDLDLLTMHRGF